ncbi:MAG TPA: C1 family peptidase [Kouleothrix sp.]|uniref:aminopeptidase C n=1 Tax=Kouleothrix sp. TaxID=2779161 RepID=UPI002BA4554C|nr:C1 family peptidase [Kouleothrix sp.]
MAQQRITPEQIASYQEAFERDPQRRLAGNAVAKSPISAVALNRRVIAGTDHTFSIMLKSNPITNQNRSGRCWLFAGLNLFRVEAIKRLNVESFELSQNYLLFWDKLEKANYFLETVLSTLDEPSDGRLLMFLLQAPLQDGGQWDMFVNLVKKYGVVPKSVMPETESSASTGAMTGLMHALLRENAAELRHMHAGGAPAAALRDRKQAMIGNFYQMLCVHLGEPPRSFEWQWRDKDQAFQRAGTLTPQEFFERYVGFDLDSLVCLIHCPTADKPFDRLYTIQHLGNVAEGQIVRYLNVDMAVFKQAAVEMLKDGQPVWFGCDVGKMLERDLGILDMELFDYASVYGFSYRADKAERVEYGHSMMTHAMVFTGVDLDADDRPRKWRVENSWGDKIGDKGFLVMSDRWFDEYMYEVVVDKRFVPAALLPLLEADPTVLPPWDPMGALAAAE